MTHEELLANISYITGEFWVRINTNDSELLNAGDALSALRAVVELHKPKVKLGTPNDLLCEECARQCTGNGHLFYPCPTIQAIEEQLK